MKQLWLTRDEKLSGGYALWRGIKPRLGENTYGKWVTLYGDGFVRSFCPNQFESITGIKLAPGEIRRVKKISIELEE